MKPSNQFGVTVVIGGGIALVGLAGKPLGLPTVLSAIYVLVGMVTLVEAAYQLKKAKVRGPDTHGTLMAPESSVRARIRFFWFVAVGIVLASVLMIPLLPYTVESYSPQLLYAVIPAQVLVVGAFLYYLRRRILGSRTTREEDRSAI